jgi:hypothetical protein
MCTVHVYDIGDKDMKSTAKKNPISIDIEQVVILVCKIGQSERYEKPNFIASEMIWSPSTFYVIWISPFS